MSNKDFDTVFSSLRAILEPYSLELFVVADTKEKYSLDTRHVMYNRNPLFFGAVSKRKNYVSFYLMPIYACPNLIEKISPSLKKRMQGKSCFNFTTVDEKLFDELAKLTKAGFDRFDDDEFVGPLLNPR